MKKPKNLKQLCSFLGLVTFYHDMWPQCTNLLSTTKYIWSNEHDIAFLRMKSLVIKDTLLVFPDPNKQFLIETDASNYQLGAVIKQCNDELL